MQRGFFLGYGKSEMVSFLAMWVSAEIGNFILIFSPIESIFCYQ